MSTVYLNIGSNKGDRLSLIERAVALIATAYPEASIRRAPYVMSEPWGYESDHEFLNLGIALDMLCQPDPWHLLDVTQGIERTISTDSHRNADGSYRDREIDIDIIAIDDLRITSDRLTLPHPRAALRPFVTVPLTHLGYDLTLLSKQGTGQCLRLN